MNLCSSISKRQPSHRNHFSRCVFLCVFLSTPISCAKVCRGMKFFGRLHFTLETKIKWLINMCQVAKLCVYARASACVWQLNGHYQESKVKYIYIDLSTLQVNSIRTDQINVFLFSLFFHWNIFILYGRNFFRSTQPFHFLHPHSSPSRLLSTGSLAHSFRIFHWICCWFLLVS